MRGQGPGKKAREYLEWLSREAAKSGRVRISQKNRAQTFGRSQRTIRRYEAALREAGLISVQRAMDRETFVVLLDLRRRREERRT